MKIKAFLNLFAFCLMSINSFSQDFENYHTLLSKGPMPEDFKLIGSEKYKKEVDNINSKESRNSDKQNEKDFALQSNFALSNLMMSGRVIYGDELGAYVNKIADLLLKDDLKLRNELRFYILKSTVANAFSTNQGVILITTGLIAQVENEAQLAFVISHEIIHYLEKHNYEAYKKKALILSKVGRNSTMTIENKLRKLYNYSKNNEMEADKKGMELFLKSNYNPYSALSLMDVLLYSYLPYDMVDWNPSVFETEFYKFPEKYTDFELDEISVEEDDDDLNRTHPNIAKRKYNVLNILESKSLDTSENSFYLISKSDFTKVQKIARFELASLYLKSGNPAKAYYLAFLLDNTYGANTYTDKIKATCIYSLAHHNYYRDDLDYYGCNPDNYEGDVQRLPKFFNKLKVADFSVLGSKYLWEISSKYPKDAQLKRMRDQLFKEMFSSRNISKTGFVSFNQIPDTVKKAGNSKVQKIKRRKKAVSYDKYYYGAFYELMKDKKFETYFNNMALGSLADSNENDEDDSEDDEPLASKKVTNKSAKKDKIKKIILFLPEYTSYSNHASNLIGDEKKQRTIKKYYVNEAERVGIKLFVIDKSDKENFDTEAFNNFSLLMDWLTERINNDTLTMELYQKGFIENIFKEYDSEYLGWTGFYYTHKKLESLFILYNVETGSPVQIKYDYKRKRPAKLTIRGLIFNQLYEIKHGK